MRLTIRYLTSLALLVLAAAGLVAHARAQSGTSGSAAPAWVSAAPGAASAVPGRLLVKYETGTRTAQRAALRSRAAVQPIRTFGFIDVELVAVPDGDVERAAAALRSAPGVRYVEPDAVVHADVQPGDPRFGEQWSLLNEGQTGGLAGADIAATLAWDVTTGDSTVLVGVVDTGIDLDHPDLMANLWRNPGEIAGNGVDDDGNGWVDDVHGYDFVNRDGDPDDDHGHGTHVAGTIAAAGDNGLGISGVAWRAKLVALKFLNNSGSGATSDAIAAIEYAVRMGIPLMNHSWGGGALSQSLLDAVNAAGAAGQLTVAAAGNRARDNDRFPHYPSSFDTPYVIAVASTNADDGLSSFSNYGAASVDLAAPGTAILSTLPEGSYGLLSGTSMATPHVTGALALIRSRLPALTALQARSLLLGVAQPLASLNGLVVTAARLNAFLPVAAPDSIPPGPVVGLSVTDVGSNSVRLSWLAPGDDGAQGRASGYDVRYAPFLIDTTNLNAAFRVEGPAPQSSGSLEQFVIGGLHNDTEYTFIVRALDELGNVGPLPAPVAARTLGPPSLAMSPDSLSAVLDAGTAAAFALALSNTREGTLDFTIPRATLRLPQTTAGLPRDPAIKGVHGAPGTPVIDGEGGPDGFGYRWVDSDAPDGPTFEWVDITATGTRLNLSGDDAVSAPVEIGFDFPFYGDGFQTLRVCTNGFVSFTDGSAPHTNQRLPGTDAPENLIAPFWDDLLFAGAERAWVHSDGSRFVVTWLDVPHYVSGGPYTFQLLLFPTGEIRFQYLDMAPSILNATIGIQNADRSDGLTVAHNTNYVHDGLAVRMLPLPQWLVASPAAGRVRAGEQVDIEMRLDASGLLGGVYEADLHVLSNDPDRPDAVLPVRLDVIGAPDIRVRPAVLDFGTLFTGESASIELEVANQGTDALVVSSVESLEPDVTVDGAGFSLPPTRAHTLAVRYAPALPGSLALPLRIRSNDPDSPVLDVILHGRAQPPPVAGVSPGSLSVALNATELETRSVRIANHGGSDLTFRARATLAGGDGSAAAQAGVRQPDDPGPGAARAKGAADDRFGLHAEAAGGPDAFGYGYRDSRDAAGPRFAWIDVRGTGTRVPVAGDDVTSGPVPIGFAFPFYGRVFTELRVCTNGWVSFSSTSNAFANTPLPSAADGVPGDLLAVFWDDLHFRGVERAWVHSDGRRTVIQYEEVGRLAEIGIPNTFQIVLHRDGRIVFQYLAMKGHNLRSATVGIQNGSRDDGLLVAMNTAYVGDSLAIEFSPPAGWLRVTPESGSVPPDGFVDLDVGFDAAGLLGGRYGGIVDISLNDPLRPAVAVVCSLGVTGAPLLAVERALLSFDPVYVGHPRTLRLAVRNDGTDTLHVQDARVNDARYRLSASALTIPPFEALELGVTLESATAGPADAEILMRTNDPLQPVVGISVTGTIVPAPQLELPAGTRRAALTTDAGPTGLGTEHRVLLRNAGGSPLDWSADAVAGPRLLPPVASLRPAAAAKGARETSGVPSGQSQDAAGYAWVSSDAPLAPAFDWIDITTDGTTLPIDADDVSSGPVTLPFAFPFYSRTFDELYVSSNGFASFTNRDAAYANTPLPGGPGTPEHLVAPFWDDLDLRPSAGGGRVLVHGNNERFVVTWEAVPHFGSPEPYTFQAVLHRDGAIDFQYLVMAGRLDEATAGIQNGERNVGLQVVHNAPFVHDGLRVSIRRQGGWLTVHPRSGRIPPGGADTLTVRFDASGREDGDYRGVVRVSSGDPARPFQVMPATMHVGTEPATVRLVLDPGLRGDATRSVEAHVTFSMPRGGEALRTARVWCAGVPSLPPGQALPAGTASEAVYRFDRAALLAALERGDGVGVPLVGEVTGQTWFAARDTVRMLPPHGIEAEPFPWQVHDTRRIEWKSDEAPASTAYDLFHSADGGRTWSSMVRGLRETAFDWAIPGVEGSEHWIEIAAQDLDGYRGSAFLGPFTLLPGTTPPVALALRLAGRHPARGSADFDLAVPARRRVRVDVYDIRGARVARLAERVFEAGQHRLTWDGRTLEGGAAAAGVYFLRAEAGVDDVRLRVVLLQ